MDIRSILKVLLTTAIFSPIAFAQDIGCGAVTYRQTDRYDFTVVFSEVKSPEVDAWIAQLPRSIESVKMLHFTPEQALFLEAPGQEPMVNPLLQQALQKADYFKPPQPTLLQLYTDLKTGITVRQVEFMTRRFVISGKQSKSSWKLIEKTVKVLGHLCMAAKMNQGDDVITAYFTAEIPVPLGPADFHGLPGLILAVEINGETTFLATDIDLTPPAPENLIAPVKGKKLSADGFKHIQEEKHKEWQLARRSEKKGSNLNKQEK